MMKTPDEIKAGLRHCAADKGCKGCTYKVDSWTNDCIGLITADALAYIQHLEAENIKLKEGNEHENA